MPGFRNAVIIFGTYVGYETITDYMKAPSTAELDEMAKGLVYERTVGELPELVSGQEAFSHGKSSHGHGH
jgi:hypothetical protein